jgi:hypothetical protein
MAAPPPTVFTPIINTISNGINIGTANIGIGATPIVSGRTGPLATVPISSNVSVSGGVGLNLGLQPGVGIAVTGRW